MIRYHVWWPNGDYPLCLEDSASVHARFDYYGGEGVPRSYVDGQSAGYSPDLFPGMYEDRIDTDSPLVIDIEAEVVDDSVDLQVDVSAERDPAVGALRLRIAVVESYIFYPGPFGYDVWNEAMRTMIPDAGGQALEISQGDTVHFSQGFGILPHWNRINLGAVVFVQSDETGEILQGARWHYPEGAAAVTVEDGLGLPVENAFVELPGTYRSDSTDALGQVLLRYGEGDHEIVTTATGFFPDTTMIEIVVDSTTSARITLNGLPTGSLAGTVTDSSTTEGIGAEVILRMNGMPWDSTSTDPQDGFFSFGDLPISLENNVEYDGLVVVPALPYPTRNINQVITITGENTTALSTMLNPADVLLVDDDEGLEYEDYFIPALESADRTQVRLDLDSSGPSFPEAIPLFPASTTVVWFTGDADSLTLTQADQDGLRAFLERGGKLFLTGQNIVEDLTSRESTFLADCLHTEWIDNVPIEYAMVLGDSADPLGRELDLMLTFGDQGANNQTSMDIMEVLPGANPAACYSSLDLNRLDPGDAAIWTEGPVPGSRVVLFGFGFEAISLEEFRDSNMRSVLDWLDGTTAIDEPDGSASPVTPRGFSLGQNFPNPFNPTTTITFEIPVPEEGGTAVEKIQTELSIFDIRGKRVRVLVDEAIPAGKYNVTWNGRNGRGMTVSSGTYFYRIRTDAFRSTRKMTIVK